MRLKSTVALTVLLGLCPAWAYAQQQRVTHAPVSGSCAVARVIDGDTFVCRDGNRVRLLLVDAPEKAQKPFGARARARLLQLMPVGTVVTLELDVQQRDRYGRVLAYVYRGGNLVNRQLVRDGMAVVLVYPPNVRYVDQFRATADSARLAKRGLWATSAFECAPRDYRAGKCRL